MATSFDHEIPHLNAPATNKDIEEEVDDNPIEEVRLTVPITDDPTEPALTFRTWVIGLVSCVALAFANRFLNYRTNPIGISSVTIQIIALPIGKFMAATLPTKKFRFPLTKKTFSLNPGPFSLKEHVLITIFASCGSLGVYAVYIITIVKVFYHRGLNPIAAMLLAQTTQLLGYGWAGMFRTYLVDSPYMWWPGNLVQVSLFRALHEKDKRPKGEQSRLQFFLIVFISSFAYYVIPAYFFQAISALSVICWIWKKNVTMQQIGSGVNGLGLFSFGLDWSSIAGYLGSPLATPFFVIANVMFGFILFIYILVPIAYWNNWYEAKRFPIYSSRTFDIDGHKYNITRVLNETSFVLDQVGYENYSKLYLGIIFAFVYGLSFATLTATISHVAFYDGNMIWSMWKKASTTAKSKFNDVHTRLMKKNYPAVPMWWFHIVLILSVALSIFACEGFGKQLQLPWWGVLLACAIAFFFTLPIGIIQATTNMQPGLNVITELIIGYMYPGKPLANVTFKTYGYISMSQALNFIQDFKLGHYMKIPPRSMFIIQFVGTIVGTTVHFGTAWWLLSTVENICDTSLLPADSPWTCPNDAVFYSASIIWGVIGPGKMFTSHGIYPQMNWFFLIGFLAPIPFWWLSRKFPEKKWLKAIHMPMILGATISMPPARAVHYWSWGVVGILFNYYIFRRYKGWWARYNYILSAALDAGVAFLGIIIFFALQNYDVSFPEWWGMAYTDHCDLAACPTAPGSTCGK